MRKEVKDIWVEALRSGKYTQGRHYLANSVRDEDHPDSTDMYYCCLGVLCDVASQNPEFVRQNPDFDACFHEPVDVGYAMAFDNATESLPDSVRQWAEIDDAMGTFYTESHFRFSVDEVTLGNHPTNTDSLAAMNDRGYDFVHIADVIDDIWERL